MTLLKIDYRLVARNSRFLVTWRCLHLVKGRLIGEVWQKSRDFNLGKLYITRSTKNFQLCNAVRLSVIL